MAEITASLVKELREKTNAGMMDCKKALIECDGDFEKAVDWLRTKGLAAAAKKSSRVATEGLVCVMSSGDNLGVVVEVNSETDFVARNDKFQDLVKAIAKVALDNKLSTDALKTAAFPGTGRNVEEEVKENIAIIGENLTLRRSAVLEASNGVVCSYLHNAVIDGLGKIGVLVALESTMDKELLKTLGKQIAMHIAAAKPDALTTAEVDADALAREKSIFSEQARASGKPESIIDKMVEGRVRKYYEEVVLLEQVFIMDNKTKISDVLAQFGKEHGAEVSISGFVRFTLGEGIEKEESDFAAEVAAAAKQ